ncbi:DUF1205 domain-containing protein [Thermobifida alba]|jgi:glycosyltransferase (activator-dependent family)|uniref:DUF1205 domain-containing protein n=1 Tax=Thermobifida alba TaxID=53522 RepID=A0ABY4L419_THEAE|nr:nucleotide disphospho-sugar-binding domain-containing protein [Thermobifida alba]UPT20807.1 DUF1205 domain-containing protein [Thermobifida alba]
MRVLFTAFEGSHFNQLVPMAWALRAAGHEVLAACKRSVLQDVVRSGLPTAPLDAPPIWELLDDFHRQSIAHYTAVGTRGPDGSPPTWEELLAQESILVPCLYARLNHITLVRALTALARGWQPDLVIWENTCFAASVAAVASGAAHARMVSGPELSMQVRTRTDFLRLAGERPPEQREDPTAEWLGALLEDVESPSGFEESLLTGQWTIDTRAPSTRTDAPVPTVPVRYVPSDYGKGRTASALPPPNRPRVCLTLGTSIAEAEYALFDLTEVLFSFFTAMAGESVEIVAAVTPQQREQMPPLPADVVVADYLPLDAVLPTCSAVVHHGGYQTKLTAELYGVPQVLLCGYEWVTESMGADYEMSGAVLSLPLRRLNARTLRSSVLRVLREPSYREAAQRVRREMLAMPAPNDAVPALEELTRLRRPASAVRGR